MLTLEGILGLMPLVAHQEWYIDINGCIRNHEERCPGCALIHEISGGDVDFYISVCETLHRLGYNRDTPALTQLARIADNNTSRVVDGDRLRRDLRDMLGV